MNRFFWIILITIIIVASISGYFIYQKQKLDIVTINGKDIKVELALTQSQREKGLSGRNYLDKNSGMLFVFPQAGNHSFWMKDTLIPLDIIWLAPSLGSRARLESEVEGMYRIVDMTTLQPQTFNNIPQYTPKSPAEYVLEVNAGFAAENNIKLGDEVKIKI